VDWARWTCLSLSSAGDSVPYRRDFVAFAFSPFGGVEKALSTAIALMWLQDDGVSVGIIGGTIVAELLVGGKGQVRDVACVFYWKLLQLHPLGNVEGNNESRVRKSAECEWLIIVMEDFEAQNWDPKNQRREPELLWILRDTFEVGSEEKRCDTRKLKDSVPKWTAGLDAGTRRNFPCSSEDRETRRSDTERERTSQYNRRRSSLTSDNAGVPWSLPE
jgi:hypothetical protein